MARRKPPGCVTDCGGRQRDRIAGGQQPSERTDLVCGGFWPLARVIHKSRRGMLDGLSGSPRESMGVQLPRGGRTAPFRQGEATLAPRCVPLLPGRPDATGADAGPRGPLRGGRTEGPTLRREPAVGPVGDVVGQSFRHQRSSPPRTRPYVMRAAHLINYSAFEHRLRFHQRASRLPDGLLRTGNRHDNWTVTFPIVTMRGVLLFGAYPSSVRVGNARTPENQPCIVANS